MKTRGIINTLRFFWAGLNHLFWPAVCSCCNKSVSDDDGDLCQACWDSVTECVSSEYCRRCGREGSGFGVVGGACPNCQGEEIYFDGIARGGIYTGVLQQMLLGFKNGRTQLDRTISLMMNPALQGSEFSNDIDMFVPVPLHWRRRLGRGYNQSLILAKGLRGTKGKINNDLVRVRYTKQQSAAVSAASRVRNVKGAFAVRYGHTFSGRNICLVDDIKTTGATLNECAKTLKGAGAGKVYAVVAAVAGQGQL